MNGLQYRMLLVIASRRVEKSEILLTMKDFVVGLIGELPRYTISLFNSLSHGAEIAQHQL